MEKRVISSEEFINRFVKCLEKGKDFILEDCIVEGDVDIEDIYKRIKDSKRLKGATIENIEDKGIIDKHIELMPFVGINTIININIDIKIVINNVKFNGNFMLFQYITYSSTIINKSFEYGTIKYRILLKV